MPVIISTLPADFVETILAHARASNHTRSLRDVVDEAILAVLHRPLSSEEKWAIIDRAANNSPGVTLNQAVIDRIAHGGRQ